ncbi:MAG TPA: RtcB family protein [Rhizomicrobium sp.]|jgi:tRNA-splicing ligase RtcB
MVQIFQQGGAPIHAWIEGVPIEEQAKQQLINVASLPFIHDHVAVMPDVHWGRGATVGSVIPTRGAIVPAAVGVDIGCGMMAVRTSLAAGALPDSLSELRSEIERAVPHGGHGAGGGWGGKTGGIPASVMTRWRPLEDRFKAICEKHPHFEKENALIHLGSLGSGNHFIELCLDEEDRVWVMLHSGSRGIGNAIGRFFIEAARELLVRRGVHVPDKDLAWLAEGEPEFADYIEAMLWAQDFAMENRKAMMDRILRTSRDRLGSFTTDKTAVNCHHNYASKEHHFGADVWITRKGAVRAREGDLGIIPGSMGARSFIVRGKGNVDSFHTCSHGAGRAMSRSEAKRRFTVEDHEKATAGIECRKDAGVIDETPMAYKDIDAVMAAQKDLVDIVHTLRQVICVKG